MTTKTISAYLEDEHRKHADTQLRMEEEGEKTCTRSSKKTTLGEEDEVHIDDPFTAKTTS
jgi:hypothetical protein